MRGLTIVTANSFYNSLKVLYKTHGYFDDRTWNCDKIGILVGRNGSALVICKRGARNVLSVVRDKKKWMSILVCIKAARTSIPNAFHTSSKIFRQWEAFH